MRRRKRVHPVVWVVLALVLSCVVVAGVAGVGLLIVGGRPAADQPRVHRPGEEALVGSVGVKVHSARNGNFLTWGAAGRVHQHDGVLIVLALVNHDPKRAAGCRGQTGRAILVDDLGNEYPSLRQDREFRAGPDGGWNQLDPDAVYQVLADRTEGDVLSFGRIVPAARQLTLTLDARCYGGTGTIRFRLQDVTAP